MKSMRKNQGFTLVEVMVVIVILGLLMAVVGQQLGGRAEDGKVGATGLQLRESFPSQIGLQYMRSYDCASITKADLEARGANSKTSWGENWTVSNTTADTVEITYPLASSKDPESAGSDLASTLQADIDNGSSSIITVNFTNPNLVIDYQCR